MPGKDCTGFVEVVEGFIEGITATLPASSNMLQRYCSAQASDPICAQVLKYCRFGWPNKHLVQGYIKPYWTNQGSFNTHNGLLLMGDRIVVPKTMQKKPYLRYIVDTWVYKDASYVPGSPFGGQVSRDI